MGRSCFIKHCSQCKQKNTSFHLFPTNPELRERWCQTIKTLNEQENAFAPHGRSYVCGHHFTDSDKYIEGRKTMLHKDVVPSIFLKQCALDQSQPKDMNNEPDVTVETEPPVNKKNLTEKSSSTASDGEEFFGFGTDDLKEEAVGSTEEAFGSTEEVDDIASVKSNDGKDETSSGNDVELKNEVNRDEDSADCNEIDDEIIFVENKVEVIEIEDDDDSQLPQVVQTAPMAPIKIEKQFSKHEIQQMVIANHPDVQLLKPKLDWKSDQFRLVYINGKSQNFCTCIRCWELFEEINIDNVVRHARCNPTPNVSPCSKRRKLADLLENIADISEISIQKITVSKLQTLAACMDVQSSKFYQKDRFLNYAQFLIDTGANAASANKNQFIYEPKYEFLSSFRERLKANQSSKISAILSDPKMDFSLSCEVWEDNFRRKTNVSLSLHYLDEDFLLQRLVIGVKSIHDVNVDDSKICDQLIEISKIYSSKKDGMEFFQRATALVTSKKMDVQSLETNYFPSACTIINMIADEIIHECRLNIAEKCVHVIGWLNSVSTEKITEFDARKWENIFDLFKKFDKMKTAITLTHHAKETTFPQDHSILRLLEPFHNAIVELSESENSITKVFGVYKTLQSSLLQSDCDIVKLVRRKALSSLRSAFDSDAYQICMFLNPCNRKLFNSLESDKIDSLQSKIDQMINPYMSSSKENGCVDNDLIHYMDDDVTSQPNQIYRFLHTTIPSKDEPYEFWRHNQDMPGLKALARKYFNIPTYASLSDCKFSGNAKEFLMKRNTLEIKDMETMLMMNSSQF